MRELVTVPLLTMNTSSLGAVEFLLSFNGLDLDVEDSEGRTPLFLASAYGYNRIVQLLVGAGADLEHSDVRNYDATALVAATAFGYDDTVQVGTTSYNLKVVVLLNH